MLFCERLRNLVSATKLMWLLLRRKTTIHVDLNIKWQR